MKEIRFAIESPGQLVEVGPVAVGVVTHSDLQRGVLEERKEEIKRISGNVLFDTGSNRSHVDKSVAEELNLSVMDRGVTNSVTHRVVRSDVYEMQVIIEGHSFYVEKAASGDLEPLGLIATLGRDILSRGKLEYDGRKGVVKFMFS